MLVWDYRTPGIPDELFERTEEVPITKEDIRAIAISKLRLKEGYSAIDVGWVAEALLWNYVCRQKAKYMPLILTKKQSS